MGLPANSLLQTFPSFFFGKKKLGHQVDPDKTGHVDFPDFLRRERFSLLQKGVLFEEQISSHEVNMMIVGQRVIDMLCSICMIC